MSTPFESSSHALPSFDELCNASHVGTNYRWRRVSSSSIASSARGSGAAREEKRSGDDEESADYVAICNEPDSIYTGEPYLKRVVQGMLRDATARGGVRWKVYDSFEDVPREERARIRLQWDVYENIDWSRALNGAESDGRRTDAIVVNGYCNRNGLIRKAHLCAVLNKAARKIGSAGERLIRHVPRTVAVSIDPRPDWFGLSIADVTETIGEERADDHDASLWILKPSRFDRGDDKHVVRDAETASEVLWKGRELVEWVCQEYIARPMLAHGRKFHLRANVLAVGALEVFLHEPSIIVTTAALPYKTNDLSNPHVHLSNAIFARTYHTKRTASSPTKTFREENYKFMLPRLAEMSTTLTMSDMLSQMRQILHDVFKVFETEINGFMPHPHCFELFGVDFMIDETGHVFLLEINAGCDNESMFGDRYASALKTLLNDVLRVAVDRRYAAEEGTRERHNTVDGDVVVGGFRRVLRSEMPRFSRDLRFGVSAAPSWTATPLPSVTKKKRTVSDAVARQLRKHIVPGRHLRVWNAGDEYTVRVDSIDASSNRARLAYVDDDLDFSEDEWVDMDDELLDRVIGPSPSPPS